MEGIRVQKAGKPVVEFSRTLIEQTKGLAQGWEEKPDKSIARMLHRAIPGYNMTKGAKFRLSLNIPGGKTAIIPMETIDSDQLSIIDLVPQGKIHVC